MLCIYPHTWRVPDALCWVSYMCRMLPASMHEQRWLLYDPWWALLLQGG
jgi:hypothetical protein